MGASADGLVAQGIPAGAAQLIGERIGLITLAGTTAITATAILGGKGTVLIVTAAASQTGGRLPGSLNVAQTREIYNTSAVDAIIYPPTGSTINGLAIDTGVTVPANKSALFRVLTCVNGLSAYGANVSA